MDIRQLKYFITIADEACITAAAKQLNMSQPPLSHQLQLLENELGEVLFERKNRQLKLTPAGKILYKQAKQLINDYNNTLDIFKDLKKGSLAKLNIGCVTSVAALHFHDITDNFFKENPDLKLHIYENNTGELLKLLDDNKIELCIIKGNIDTNLYSFLNINSLISADNDCMAAVAKPEFFHTSDEVINFKELEDYPLFIQSIHEELLTNACMNHNFIPNIVSTHENVLTPLCWATEGLGISIMPYSSAKLASSLSEGDNLTIKKLIDPVLFSDTYIVWKKKQELSVPAHNFIEYIFHIFQE